MCFGPSQAEKDAAAKQRSEAEQRQRHEAKMGAEQKREDISDALSARSASRYGSKGGKGRRSLLQSYTSSGFLGRF